LGNSQKSRVTPRRRVLGRGGEMGLEQDRGLSSPAGLPKGDQPANNEVVEEEASKMALTIFDKDLKLTSEEQKNLRDSLLTKIQSLLDLAQISSVE